MSWTGGYLEPNWYWDQGYSTKEVLDLIRRSRKEQHRGRKFHAAAARKHKLYVRNRLEVFILSPAAAELERKGLNPSYRGPPASRVNYPYRGRGQEPDA